MADSAACRRVVATFSHYSPERVVSLAILGGFAVLYLGMLARRACALRRHRSRPRSEDTADKLTPDAGGRAAVRALASRAAIGSRSTFHLLVAAYIILCTFWYFHPFQPFLGQARNAAFGLAMQGFFHFSVDRVKWTRRGRRSKMRAMLVTCDYLVFALLYCNVVGMYTTGERSVGSCGCLPTKCSLFTITTDLLLAVVYIAVSCGFIGLLNKLIRQLMNTSTMSKSARRRQTSEIAKLLAVSVANIICQLARIGVLAVSPARAILHSTSEPVVPSVLIPAVYGALETLPFFFFLLISTGGIVGRTSTPSAVERTLERLGYNGVEIMAQAGARRAERAVTGRPHRGWLALDVSCTELIIEDRQLGIALPSLFHGKSFFVSLQVAPPPPGRGTQEQQGGAAEEASVYADSEGAEQHSPAVLDSQEWTEVSRSDVVESPARPAFLLGPMLPPSLGDNSLLRVGVYHTQPHRPEDAPVHEYSLAAYMVLAIGQVRALTSDVELLDSAQAGRRSIRRVLHVTGQSPAVRVLQQAEVVLQPHVVPLWVPYCAQALPPPAAVPHPGAHSATLSGSLGPLRRGGPDAGDSPRTATGGLLRATDPTTGNAGAPSATARTVEGDLIGAVTVRSFCLRFARGEDSMSASTRAGAQPGHFQRQGTLLHRLASVAAEPGRPAPFHDVAAPSAGAGTADRGLRGEGASATTVMAVEQVQEAAEALPVACSALQVFAAERYRVAATLGDMPALRKRHLSTAQDYERKVQGLWALLRRGRMFKASTEKKDDLLSHVATNLHVQRIGAPDPLDVHGYASTASDLIIVTVGIPSAHYLGVKGGGLAHRLQEAQDQARELASLLLSHSPTTTPTPGTGAPGSSSSSALPARSGASGEAGAMSPATEGKAPLLSGAALGALISSQDAFIATTVHLARQALSRALGGGGAAALCGHHRDAILLGATAVGYHAYAPVLGAETASEGPPPPATTQLKAKGKPAEVSMTDTTSARTHTPSPPPGGGGGGGHTTASDSAAGTRDSDVDRRVHVLRELLFNAGLRLEAALCQSLSAMVASWTRLAQMHAEGMLLNPSNGHPLDRPHPRSRAGQHYMWWEQQLRTGFLFELESLVSTRGGESGMLSDGGIAVSELSRVTIRLVRDPRGPAAARWRKVQQHLLHKANTAEVSVQNPLSQCEALGPVGATRDSHRLSVGTVDRDSASRRQWRAATAGARPTVIEQQQHSVRNRSKSSTAKHSAKGRDAAKPYAVPPSAAEEAEGSLARSGTLPDPYTPLVRFLCVSLEPVAACGHVAPQWRRRYLNDTAASTYGWEAEEAAPAPAPSPTAAGAGPGGTGRGHASLRNRPKSWELSSEQPQPARQPASRASSGPQEVPSETAARRDVGRLASALRQIVVTVAVEPTVFEAVRGLAPAHGDYALPPPRYASGTRAAEGSTFTGRATSHRRQRGAGGGAGGGEGARDEGGDEESGGVGRSTSHGPSPGAPASSPMDLAPQRALAGVDVRDALFVDVTGVLFSQGINEAQTVANSRNSKELALQDDVNVTSALALHEYTEHYLRTSGHKRSARTITALHDMLSRLDEQVEAQESQRRKRVELLQLAADIVRALRGGRATSCKSAKDRTSMSVTLEQGRVLRERYGLSSEGMQELVDAMRLWGVRRENARKNVGKPRFAFNRVQLQLFPREYRPPLQTIGSVVT